MARSNGSSISSKDLRMIGLKYRRFLPKAMEIALSTLSERSRCPRRRQDGIKNRKQPNKRAPSTVPYRQWKMERPSHLSQHPPPASNRRRPVLLGPVHYPLLMKQARLVALVETASVVRDLRHAQTRDCHHYQISCPRSQMEACRMGKTPPFPPKG